MDRKDVGLRLLSYYTNLPLAKPEMINIGLTQRCNFRCKICNTWEEGNSGEELGVEELKGVIDEIGEWGDIGVSFAGGEPLLRKKALFQCLRFAEGKGLTTYMTTNCSMIDGEVAEDIAKSGLDFISLSLDGISKETNDYIRDDGAYESVLHAIENLKKYKKKENADLKIGLTTVVTDVNLDELLELHEFTKDKDLHEINYNPYVPDNSFMGKVDYEGDEFWISGERIEELKDITEKMLQIKRSEEGRIGTSEFILKNMPPYFEERENFSKGKCLAGQSYMYIKPSGNVDVCGKGPSFDFRPMNVKEKGVKEIWRSLNFFLTRLKIKNCDRPCLMLCFPKVSLRNFVTEVID